MTKLEWSTVEKLDWRKRNAAVEAALREFLTAEPTTTILGTRGLAAAICSEDGVDACASVLMKLAKWMPNAMATHDGEVFRAYGKINKRWRWHGQAAPVEEWTA